MDKESVSKLKKEQQSDNIFKYLLLAIITILGIIGLSYLSSIFSLFLGLIMLGFSIYGVSKFYLPSKPGQLKDENQEEEF